MCCRCFCSAAAAATTNPVLPPMLPLLTQRQQGQQHGRSCLACPLQLCPRGERRLPLRPLLPSQSLSAALSFVVLTSLILPHPGPLALTTLDALAPLALAALPLTHPLALDSLAFLAALAALDALAALAALAALTTLAALTATLVPLPLRPHLPLPVSALTVAVAVNEDCRRR
jgi:hypothetical protein